MVLDLIPKSQTEIYLTVGFLLLPLKGLRRIQKVFEAISSSKLLPSLVSKGAVQS